ncbi:hypothetical protein KFE25_013755 [Diacronema lutheri]|uniref:Uncharacterized protein n=2 Tax=Diacronema lutheri TaxID=2081491 RepID=A0A8J5XUD9_DIALT|nr:hypothetical protein KFE25_013755 [Diacronema lutheri]
MVRRWIGAGVVAVLVVPCMLAQPARRAARAPPVRPTPHVATLASVERSALSGGEGSAGWANVWATLDAGEPITIVVLGTSVTAGSGGCSHSFLPFCSTCCATRDYGPSRSRASAGDGFARLALEWINATWPHAEHRLFNAGRPGGALMLYTECLRSWLPPGHIHLWLLETGITTNRLPEVERIVRLLLQISVPAAPRRAARSNGTAHQATRARGLVEPAVGLMVLSDWCAFAPQWQTGADSPTLKQLTRVQPTPAPAPATPSQRPSAPVRAADGALSAPLRAARSPHAAAAVRRELRPRTPSPDGPEARLAQLGVRPGTHCLKQLAHVERTQPNLGALAAPAAYGRFGATGPRGEPPHALGDGEIASVISRYYRLVAFSARDGLWAEAATRGGRWHRASELAQLFPDGRHPEPLGARLIADLLIDMLWRAHAAWHARMERGARAPPAAGALPPPLPPALTPDLAHSASLICYSADEALISRVAAVFARVPLHTPTGERWNPGNDQLHVIDGDGGVPMRILANESGRESAPPAVADGVARGHWQWVTMEPASSNTRLKPGLAATAVGAAVTIQLLPAPAGSSLFARTDVVPPSHAAAQPSAHAGAREQGALSVEQLRLALAQARQAGGRSGDSGDGSAQGGANAQANVDAGVYVALRFLTSYERMGVARVSCVGACACAPVEIDAYRAPHGSRANRFSLLAHKLLPDVRVDEPALERGDVCALRLRVLPRTSSPDGGHRWKLVQVSLGVWRRDADSAWPPA